MNQLFGDSPEDNVKWLALLQLEQELRRIKPNMILRRELLLKEINRLRNELIYYT